MHPQTVVSRNKFSDSPELPSVQNQYCLSKSTSLHSNLLCKYPARLFYFCWCDLQTLSWSDTQERLLLLGFIWIPFTTPSSLLSLSFYTPERLLCSFLLMLKCLTPSVAFSIASWVGTPRILPRSSCYDWDMDSAELGKPPVLPNSILLSLSSLSLASSPSLALLAKEINGPPMQSLG